MICFQTLRASLCAGAILFAAVSCSPPAKPPKTQPVAPAALARGYVDAPLGLVRINAPLDGVIERVEIEEGQLVTVGQRLCITDDRQDRAALAIVNSEVGESQARLQLAQAKQSDATREAGRLVRLSKQDAASLQESDQATTTAKVALAETAQAGQALQAALARQRLAALVLERHTLSSPVAGTLLRRMAVSGTSVTSGTPLFVIAPAGPRVVRAEVDEAFVDSVRVGAAAVVTREFDEGHPITAKVLRIADAFATPTLNDDPTSRSDSRVVSVVLELPEAPPLKFGQRVLVRFSR